MLFLLFLFEQAPGGDTLRKNFQIIQDSTKVSASFFITWPFYLFANTVWVDS